MKVFTTIFLCGFVGLMFFNLFSMGHGVDMKHAGSDCSGFLQQEVVCPMSVLEQIGTWKSVFMNALPTLSVAVLASVALAFLGIAPYLLRKKLIHKIPIVLRIQQQQLSLYTFDYRALQRFFACGVLNPKLF